jgi:Leucine-rich repeat (LRR) protein
MTLIQYIPLFRIPHYTLTPIGQLQKLKFLDVSNNELESMPASVGTLKELQTLNASCNRMTTFVDLHDMVQLHILDLSHNCLQELPEGITSSELGLLGVVLVHHNQLESLPAELCELPSLKQLDISDNKLTQIPAELLPDFWIITGFGLHESPNFHRRRLIGHKPLHDLAELILFIGETETHLCLPRLGYDRLRKTRWDQISKSPCR